MFKDENINEINTSNNDYNNNNEKLDEIKNLNLTNEEKETFKLNDTLDFSFNNYELEDSKLNLKKDTDLGSIKSIASSIKYRLLKNSKFMKIKNLYNTFTTLFKKNTGIDLILS